MDRGFTKTLGTGDSAPEVSLVDANGASRSLESLLSSGPVLLAFFKVTCPTCQLTLPLLGRLAGAGMQIIPVSQDGPLATREFAEEYGLSVSPMFDRAEDGYPASNAFGLTTVPSIFLIERDRRIVWDLIGFHRKELETLAGRIGQTIFYKGDRVPELKAG